MASALRKTGISVLGDARWGTHACLFYDTKQDLLDAVVPFFETGLEDGEYCLWVISKPLTEDEAVAALRSRIPDLDRHLEERNLELVPYTDWYLEDGRIDLGKSTDRCLDKLDQALARDYAGMRVTGNVGRLVKSDHWQSCQDYECRLSDVISDRRIIVLCLYPLAKGGATELLEVTRWHKSSGTIRNGAWEIIETPELKLAKVEIRELYQHLEQKLAERTQALRAANEVLRGEITERKKVADELRKQKEVLQKIFDHIPVMINLGEDNRLTLVNREWERTLGWTLEEIRENKINALAECYPDPNELRRVLDFISTSHGQWGDFKTRVRDGRVIDTSWSVVHLSDGTSIGFGQDVTEHKRAEERLKDTSVQLRALSASIQSAREEERARMARLIHDELGSALTSLKWDLEGLDIALAEPVDRSALLAARSSIAGMTKLADTTIDTVRRLAWELRPSILDDLGLVEALEWQAQQFEARTGIVCQRNRFAEEVQFTSEQSTEVFRIFQEALTNILRHAHASNVHVTMTQAGREFVLTVSDNGRGITAVEKSGLGILGMQERARLVGGKIAIQGIDGAGTTITLRVPLGQAPGLSN